MIPVTCRLTAKNRGHLRNPTLGNRVWATFFTTGRFNFFRGRFLLGPFWRRGVMTDNPVSDAASDDALSAAAAAAAMRCSALRCRPGGRRHPRCVHCVRLPVDKRHDQHDSFASVLGAPCEVRPAASVRLLLNPGRPPAVRQPLRRCRSTYDRERHRKCRGAHACISRSRHDSRSSVVLLTERLRRQRSVQFS